MLENTVMVKCDGYNFVENLAPIHRCLYLEELLALTEEYYMETERLKEELEDLKQDVEDNYRRIPLSEQYGVSDSDFI